MDDSKASQATGGERRAEALLAGVGLAALSVGFVVALVCLDVLLTRSVRRPDDSSADALGMYLLTHDGREVGDRRHGGVGVRLWPFAFYENVPSQAPFEINSLGLRGPEPDPAHSRPRVLVVGGSAALGVFVPEPKTFVARLRQHAPDVEVLNAGVGGYTSTQELGLVVHKLIDLEPDLVISFSGWNDVYDNVSRALMDAEARGGTPGDLRITGNFLSLEERLVNYRRLQEEPLLALLEALHTITRSSTLLSAVSSVFSGGLERQPPAHLPAEWRRALIELHVGNLLKLRDLVEARGGRLIAVTQPEVSQLQRPGLERRSNPDFLPGDHYWEVFPDLYQEFRAGVGQALEARAATWLDASAALAPRVRSARTPLFLDPVHLSPAGHETMAALLIEPMRRGLREARGRDRRPAP